MKNNQISLNQVAAQRIRIMRKIMGMSQSNLANKLCVSTQQIQKYETGQTNISLNTLAKISSSLGTTPNDLIQPETKHNSLGSITLESKDQGLTGLTEADLRRIANIKSSSLRSSFVKLIDALDAAKEFAK